MLRLRILVPIFSLFFLAPGEIFSQGYRERILHSSYSSKQLSLLRSWSYDKEKLLAMSKASVDSGLYVSARPLPVNDLANPFVEGVFLDPVVLKRVSHFEKLIDYYSRKYSIEPNLVKAIIYVESSANPRSISPKGARGLMQLMPGTAATLGVRNLFDPAENIAGGTKFLHQQIKRFGHIHLALWAYNAGPKKVVERILPLTTYHYILKVLLVKLMLDRGL